MTANRTGLLVVNRIELLRQARTADAFGLRRAIRGMSDDEVFAHYRGFDGLAWPCLERISFELQDGLAPIAELPNVETYFATLDTRDECEIIALSTMKEPVTLLRHLGWQMVGFDLGFFESEWSHYSILLNELVYGLEPELRHLAVNLNEFLLLDSIGSALDIQLVRRGLVARGADLEQVDSIEAIAIVVRPGGP